MPVSGVVGGELCFISPPKKRFMRVYKGIGGELFNYSPPFQAIMWVCGFVGGEFHHRQSRKPA